jgi:hypothetical protein
MIEQLRDFIFEYAPWLIFLPWLLALSKQGRNTPAVRAIFHYLTAAVITHLLSFALWKLKKNNLPLLHVYTVVEFLLLLRFYFLLLQDFFPRLFFYILGFAFPLLSILDSLFVENIFSFNTYSRSVEALIFIFLSVSWFVKSVSRIGNNESDIRPLHFITSGFLIYFAGSVVLFSFRDIISQFTRRFLMNVWSIHTLLLVILYILISIGLWKHNKK